jgi:hypothetical protein
MTALFVILSQPFSYTAGHEKHTIANMKDKVAGWAGCWDIRAYNNTQADISLGTMYVW